MQWHIQNLSVNCQKDISVLRVFMMVSVECLEYSTGIYLYSDVYFHPLPVTTREL